MKKFNNLWKFLFIFLLFYSEAFPLSLEKARQFISMLDERRNWCSRDNIALFKGTDIEETVKTLAVLKCYDRGSPIEISQPKNPYAAVLYAELLFRNNKKRAVEILRKIYSTTNRLDEDILTICSGKCNFTDDKTILRKKFYIALRDRDLDYAEVLLSKLKGDSYYSLLMGLLFLKRGDREKALSFLESSPIPKKYIYLTYAARSDVAKLYYFKELLNSPVSSTQKRKVAIYILDRLLFRDKGLFKSALKLVENLDPKLAQEYKVKLLYVYGYKTKAVEELKKLKSEKASAWLSAIKGSSFNPSRVDFYSLLLNPPEKFPYSISGQPNDEGLKLLYSTGLCWTLDIALPEKPSPELSYYLNLCKNYHKALRVAVKFWNRVDKKPWLLKVLFPAPSMFKGDLISLSIARQESLFDNFALSRSGAMGLMQIMPRTGEYLAQKLKQNGFKVKQLFKPEVNISLGSYYIHSLIDRFGAFPLAAAAYNCGPTRVSKALKRFGRIKDTRDLVLFVDFYLPFSETRNYVKKVLVNYYFYSNLYGTGEEWRSSLIPSGKRDTRKTH